MESKYSDQEKFFEWSTYRKSLKRIYYYISYKDRVRFSYDKFEMSYSQGNIMGELCNNALTLIVNPHSIIPTPAKEKDNVSPPPPRIRLITKPATEKPVKHTLLYA